MLDILKVFLEFPIVLVLNNLLHIVVYFILYAEDVIVGQVLCAEQLFMRRFDQLLLPQVVLGLVSLLTLEDKLSLVFILGQATVLEAGICVCLLHQRRSLVTLVERRDGRLC